MSPIIVGGRTLFGSLSSQPTGITTAIGSEYYDTTDDKKESLFIDWLGKTLILLVLHLLFQP